ncbi:MAG: UDP-galactopyranose mutase [Roseburia sp.]|nr:UDP-galactopyranose mutase [Roseburia sp.]
MYDFLIVGSGLFGATFSWCAQQAGKTCLVIDRRKHIGGNVFCEKIQGINVHKYGPHIFHTSNKKVWKFVNQFVSFNNFILNTKANYKDNIYSLPFNMNTFYEMWHTVKPKDAQDMIRQQCYEGIVHNLEEQAISMVGLDVYEKLIKGYTEKQWGMPCVCLPPYVIRRLPVRFTFNNNYFNDTFQGIPIEGYNRLIVELLKECDVETNTDFFDGWDKKWRSIAKQLVYTGKIDDFYYCKYGSLQYRSLRFEHKIINTPNYQGMAVMNFTDKDIPYTRIVEHKHFEMSGDSVYDNPKTVVTWEYPQIYSRGNDAYYPVNNKKNNAIYAKYRQLAKKERGIIFGGRLAEYKYYNMDQVICNALNTWEKVRGNFEDCMDKKLYL